MMGESSAFTTSKETEFLVNMDHFSKYLKYLRNFEKQCKLTKNSDFFVRGERATLSHQFEQRQWFDRAKFSVNILQFLKDAVITVGVSFRLCSSFSVCRAPKLDFGKTRMSLKHCLLCVLRIAWQSLISCLSSSNEVLQLCTYLVQACSLLHNV